MAENSVPTAPSSDDRSRRVYFWWAVGLGLLLALGVVCQYLVGPFLRAKAVVSACAREADGHCFMSGPTLPGAYAFVDRRQAVRKVGGPDRAASALTLYLWLPDRLAPRKDAAIALLSACGGPGIGRLCRLAGSEHRADMDTVTWALSQCGPEAVPALIGMLGSSDVVRRQIAAGALGWIRPAPQEAVPALERALLDEDWYVRYCAKYSLGSIRRKNGD